MHNKSFQAGKLTAGHRFAIIANDNFPLKTALCFTRVMMNYANIAIDFWELRNAENSHSLNPESFWIPELDKRNNLKVGDAAKLIFDIESEDTDTGEIVITGERIYVIISKVIGNQYIGILDSQPVSIEPDSDFYLVFGAEILFGAEHVIDIDRPPEDYIQWQLGQKPEKRWSKQEI